MTREFGLEEEGYWNSVDEVTEDAVNLLQGTLVNCSGELYRDKEHIRRFIGSCDRVSSSPGRFHGKWVRDGATTELFLNSSWEEQERLILTARYAYSIQAGGVRIDNIQNFSRITSIGMKTETDGTMSLDLLHERGSLRVKSNGQIEDIRSYGRDSGRFAVRDVGSGEEG